MLMRGGSWALRERQLQAIKQQHLLRRFQHIADIVCKNYRFAFQIIKYLSLLPQPHHPLDRIVHTLNQIVSRSKRIVLRLLQRRMLEKQHLRSKAVILIATFLQRRLIGLWSDSLRVIKEGKQGVARDRQLFLMIKISNLNKLLCFAKAEAFQFIKNQCSAHQRQRRTATLIRMGMALNNYTHRLKVDSFLAIIKPTTFYRPQQDLDEDQEQIWVESYKCMAGNIRNPQNGARSLREMRKQAGARDLVEALVWHQREVMRGCLGELECFQNHRFSPSALAVLRRQIAILEQEYESV